MLCDDFIDYYETQELPKSGRYSLEYRCAAVEIEVTPSTLPEGYYVRINPPGNVFRDHPAAVVEVADIIERAQGAELRNKITATVVEIIAMNILLPRLLPQNLLIREFIPIITQVVLKSVIE